MGNVHHKKVLGLGLAGSGLASVLGATQVSADSLDDAVTSAQNKGLQVTNKGTTEVEVTTYEELDQKTAAEEKRVAGLASSITKEVDLYKNDAGKIASQNQEALNKYQQESEAVAKENKEALAKYEAELARVKASNAEKERANEEARNKVLEANQKAQNDFDKATAAIASERQKLAADYQAQVDRVNAENRARISAVESENRALEADYQEKLGNYNRELFNITKANTEKKTQYEADLARATSENARIDAENKKAQADYEAEKAATEKANAEAKAKYEADKAEYEKAKKNYDYAVEIAETVKTYSMGPDNDVIQKIRDEGFIDGPERVVEIDLTNVEDGKRHEAYMQAEAQYKADTKKVEAEIESAKAKIAAGGSSSSGVSKEEYDKAKAEWVAKAREFKGKLEATQAANLSDPKTFATQFIMYMDKVIGRDEESRKNLNKHTMTFEKSSSKVRYLTTQNYDTLQEAMRIGMDPQNPSYKDSATPIQGTMGKINYYAVAIPKGESVTVEYRLTDGSAYQKTATKDNPPFFSFVAHKDSNTDKHFDVSETKNLDKIKITYKNTGSLNGDGDVVVFFANDTGIPLYTGISDMASEPGTRVFPGDSVPNRINSYDYAVEFLDKENTRLAPAMLMFETFDKPEDHNGIISGLHYRTQKSLNTTYANAATTEKVSIAKDADIEEHGVSFSNNYELIKDVPNLPADWKNTHSYMDVKTGFEDGLYKLHNNNYDKSLSDKGRHIEPTKYSVSHIATRYYMTGEDGVGYYVMPEPVPAFTMKEPVSTTITPVRYVIKFKQDLTTTEPTDPQAPSYNEVPVAPTSKPKVDLPTEPTYETAPEKPNRPQYKTPTLEAEPKKPDYPEFPQAPTPQVVPDKVTPQAEPGKPDLKPSPEKPNLIPEPKKPSFEVNRVKYVLKPRSGHGNTFVVKKMDDTKRAASGNSLVVRMKSKLGLK